MRLIGCRALNGRTLSGLVIGLGVWGLGLRVIEKVQGVG